MQKLNNDRITIGLYSLQSGNLDSILSEIANIKSIRNNFRYAAYKADRKPPEIIISLYLVPDWNTSNFANKDYIAARKEMMTTFREKLNEAGLWSVKVEDFIDKASKIEKNYLNRLTSRGSCADMIKTNALIDLDNEKRHHLQMDSNTQIHDYLGLYNTTFAASEQRDSLALNASYYDRDYISAHNKIVYTAPESNFIKTLRNVHLEYCDEHAKDHDTNPEEKSKKNSIYAKDFVVALEKLGLTLSVELIGGGHDKSRKIYPASLERIDAYRLTKYVITAVNQTWSDEQNPDLKKLKALPSVRVGDALCDFASFFITIKKYVGQMNMHKYGGHQGDWQKDVESNNSARYEYDADTRKQLFNLSDGVVDKLLIARFYDSAVDYLEENVKDGDEKNLLIKRITDGFNLQPIRGNILAQELFGCTLAELSVNPFRHSKKFRLKELINYMRLEINREEKYRDYVSNLVTKREMNNAQFTEHDYDYDYLSTEQLLLHYKMLQEEQRKIGKLLEKIGKYVSQTNQNFFGEKSSSNIDPVNNSKKGRTNRF